MVRARAEERSVRTSESACVGIHHHLESRTASNTRRSLITGYSGLDGERPVQAIQAAHGTQWDELGRWRPDPLRKSPRAERYPGGPGTSVRCGRHGETTRRRPAPSGPVEAIEAHQLDLAVLASGFGQEILGEPGGAEQ